MDCLRIEMQLVMRIGILLGIATAFSKETCNTLNETVESTSELANCFHIVSPKDRMDIRQLSTQFYHSIKTQSIAYNPDVTLDCECTCDIFEFGERQLCTAKTRNKSIRCDNNQTPTSTCTNLIYEGKTSGNCGNTADKYFRVCCQANFAIHDRQQKYQAYQLELSSHWLTAFEIDYHAGNTKNKISKVSIPNWVENLIVGNGTMLVFDSSKSIQSRLDLFDRWIYHEAQSGNFYTNVSVNGMKQLELDKLGWFHEKIQKDINGTYVKMAPIPEETLKKMMIVNLGDCKNHTPSYDWNFTGAVNYYRGNQLMSEKRGVSFSSVYEDKWFVDKKEESFYGQPALVLTTTQRLPVTIKVTDQLPIRFTTHIYNRQLFLVMNQMPRGNYTVTGGYIEYRRLGPVIIDSNVQFPYNKTFTIPTDLKWNITCIKNQDEDKLHACVHSSVDFHFQRDTENNADQKIIKDKTKMAGPILTAVVITALLICGLCLCKKQIMNCCRHNKSTPSARNGNGQQEEMIALTQKGNTTSNSADNGTSHIQEPTPYPSRHSPCGLCVIINIEKFKSSPPRIGSQNDVDALKEAFENLHFEVKIETDLDKNEIEKLLTYLRLKNYKKHDVFVCCVMSHGDEEIVYAADEQTVKIQDIIHNFNMNRIPSLKNKPKIFIIDAHPQHPTVPGGADSSEPTHSNIPTVIADAILCFTTAPGYFCLTDTLRGSHYIQRLAETLKQKGNEWEFHKILRSVSDHMDKIASELYKQMPVYCDTLNKPLFFNRKQQTEAGRNDV